jgi:type I restriction enzyme S subunit
MAGEWRASTWGEEISLEYGKALRDYDKASGKYRVFGSNGPIGWTDKPLASGPGVILGRKGAYRGIEFSRAPFFVIDTAYYVVPKSEFDMRWLYYAIKFHKLGEIDDGSPIPSTTRSAVYVRDFDVPPLAEQKAIASVLGALDDKIELNRRMNTTLEAMARALFQSWFVDFDPVRAKLDGRQPVGMDEATAALFPDSFQDSTLGHIPKGWETGSILRQADLLSGGTPKTDFPAYWNGDVPWASANDVSQCGEAFLVSTKRKITKQGVENSSTKIIPANATVVVARGATTGRLTMFDHAMAMNQTCYGLRSKVGAAFALYCNVRHFIERLVQGGHGSIFDTITTSTFEATDVLLAPKDVLLAFDKQTMPLFQQVQKNLHQSRTLATLRDTLLPKLLSGELSIN